MEDHIPIGPDRSLLLGRQTSIWSLLDVVFHENNSTSGPPPTDQSSGHRSSDVLATPCIIYNVGLRMTWWNQEGPEETLPSEL